MERSRGDDAKMGTAGGVTARVARGRIGSAWLVIAVLFGTVWASPAAADGGVNTGEPGSICAPELNGNRPPLEPGVSTTWYGADAPAYYEIGPPAGIFAGQPPKGIMLVIHGGAWFHIGPGAVAASRAEANRWRDRGWSTVNLTYRACAESVADALWFYDRSRAVAGPDLPVCATGMSAGGHLALMIAARRPDASCVVAQGAPSDLGSLPFQTAFDGGTFGQQSVGPTRVYWWSVAAFGLANLGSNSPALASIKARVLAATAEHDTLIPAAQDAGLAANLRAADAGAYVDTMRLAAGPEEFTHASISREALEAFWQHELSLVEPLVPDAPSHALPVRMSAGTMATNGSMQLGTRLTATSASVTTGSTTITLDPGYRYRVESCVGWFSELSPQSTCKRSAVIDTTAATGGTPVTAPLVNVDRVRSRVQENFVMGLVTVTRQTSKGAWVSVGTSWPASGLAGAGLSLDRAA